MLALQLPGTSVRCMCVVGRPATHPASLWHLVGGSLQSCLTCFCDCTACTATATTASCIVTVPLMYLNCDFTVKSPVDRGVLVVVGVVRSSAGAPAGSPPSPVLLFLASPWMRSLTDMQVGGRCKPSTLNCTAVALKQLHSAGFVSLFACVAHERIVWCLLSRCICLQ
jgi:hypothetical protein